MVAMHSCYGCGVSCVGLSFGAVVCDVTTGEVCEGSLHVREEACM